MISPKHAKKLQKFVKWEPKLGDWFALAEYPKIRYLVDGYFHVSGMMATNDKLFFPSLDQLLAMIEAEGYTADIDTMFYIDEPDGYCCDIYNLGEIKQLENHNDTHLLRHSFTAPSREDACAKALLWIKEGK